MFDNKIENIDIVAAILASSIINNLKATVTPVGAVNVGPLVPQSVEIFNRVKSELTK